MELNKEKPAYSAGQIIAYIVLGILSSFGLFIGTAQIIKHISRKLAERQFPERQRAFIRQAQALEEAARILFEAKISPDIITPLWEEAAALRRKALKPPRGRRA